jgi:hypothetical protein
MRFLNSLNRFRQYLRRGRKGRRPEKLHSRPRVEELEGRALLSTLNITLLPFTRAAIATYTGDAGAPSLTLSETPNGFLARRVFTDTGTPIFVTGNGAGQVTGSGTNQVIWTGFLGQGVLHINMQAGTNVVNLESIDISTTVAFSGSSGRTNTVTVGNAGSLQGINGPVAVVASSTPFLTNTQLIVDDSADTGNHSGVTISDTAITGLAPKPITYQQSTTGITGVTVDGGSGNDTFTVTNTLVGGPGFEEGTLTLNTGTGFNAVGVQATSGRLNIQGHGGSDSVYITGAVSGTLTNIKGVVDVTDTAPTTSLTVDDRFDTTSRVVSLSNTELDGLSPDPIIYQPGGLSALVVDTGAAPDTVTVTTNFFDKTPIANIGLNLDATSGIQRLSVLAVAGNLTVASAFPGLAINSTIAVVGSSAPGSGGTLANINGKVIFGNMAGSELVVDDSGDTTPRTVTTSTPASQTITGLAPGATIQYVGGKNTTFTLFGGSGGNTFNIDATNFDVISTAFVGGKGGDTFNVATTETPLILDLGTSSNRVNVKGTSLDFGSGVIGTLSVVGHGGSDTVTVGSLAPALGGTQANVHGPVNVSNITNSTSLIVDDSGDTTPRTVTIGPSSVQFSGIGAPIHFGAGVKSVEVRGGTGDSFQATATAPTIPVTLVGGPGTNTLVSGAFNNTWHLTGTNAGTLQSTIAFHNIQNLRGTALPFESDTFFFANGAGITGTIVGGGNFHTTLDYSAYTTPVTVNLKTHTATGVGGGVFFVQNVTGGQGNNILVGNGNNILRGGSGRDILISGGGTSTLQAGSGEAILIGAHYLLDTNPVALNHLMAEWSHTYDPINPLHDYQIRVGHLEHGGGLNDPFLLNGATVVPQPGTTTLTTGGGFDFLITDPGDILTKPLRPGEVDLFV